MTTEKQPEALRLADAFNGYKDKGAIETAAELRRQHARIVELESELTHMTDLWVLAHNERSAAMTKVSELESQLESIGAGGVTRLVAQADAEPVEPTNPDILNLKCESSDTSEASIRSRYQQPAIAPTAGGLGWYKFPAHLENPDGRSLMTASYLLNRQGHTALAEILKKMASDLLEKAPTLPSNAPQPAMSRAADIITDAAVLYAGGTPVDFEAVADEVLAELEAARYAYASEFPPNEDGEPDKGSIHQNIRALKLDNSLLRADAARYEFIRANGVYHLQFEIGKCGTGVYLGAAADQAIDAAIKEAKP